jgi:mannose-6-phosphate isomerase-like protein (cupin superfamily)
MTTPTYPWQTRERPAAYDNLAPDTAEIRLLGRVPGASVCLGTLQPGQVSIPVTHRTVAEIWFGIEGEGEVWRRDRATGAEEVVALRPGVAVTIPLGTDFQFRNTGRDPFTFVCCTAPDWPGPDEAYRVEGRWTPTADTQA